MRFAPATAPASAGLPRALPSRTGPAWPGVVRSPSGCKILEVPSSSVFYDSILQCATASRPAASEWPKGPAASVLLSACSPAMRNLVKWVTAAARPPLVPGERGSPTLLPPPRGAGPNEHAAIYLYDSSATHFIYTKSTRGVVHIIYRYFPPPARQSLCKFRSILWSVSDSPRKTSPPARYQLSESKSLFPSSCLFSGDVLDALFHFCAFSDSSEDDRFCLLHFARRFLNQTCNIKKSNY